METEKEMVQFLGEQRVTAPPELHNRIMQALPASPGLSVGQRLRRWWPTAPAMWVAPSLAGAVAMLLVVLLFVPRSGLDRRGVHVTFQLHAPSATRVELVGSFNDWQPGRIVLSGPDASGHWTADLDLPSGRHEYMFLVDGKTLVTDPAAQLVRRDGFGNKNAVLEI